MFETKNYKKTTQNSIKRINDIISVKNVELKNLIDKDAYQFQPKMIKKVLSNDLCDYIVNISEKTALKQSTECTVSNIKGWRTARHDSYPTTDLPVNDIPELNTLLKNIIQFDVFPHIEENYKVDKRLLYLNDLFIVKYNYLNQNELKKHKDGSDFSFGLLLNSNNNFDGGGTIIYNKDDEETLYEHTKGDLLIHPGFIKHSGKKITRGVRYLLVGFIKLYDSEEMCFNLDLKKNHISYDFKTNNSNNLNINTFEVKSELITEMYKSIQNEQHTGSKLLDMTQAKFNCFEKYIYDMFIFHMTRLNLLNDIDNYYVEYWQKKYDRKITKRPLIHPIHIDKDEHLFKKTKELVTPFLGTITYLSGDNLPCPTVIINNNQENTETNCINLKHGLALSFPKKCKHISFNVSNYHSVYDLAAFDENVDLEQDTRITLLFNIWQKRTSNIKLDGLYKSTLEKIYTKNDKITEIISTNDELTIKIRSIEMYDLLNNIFKQNHKLFCQFICKHLPNDKDNIPAIVYFDINT